MELHLYWVSAFTYALFVGLILLSDVKVTKVPGKIENSFRQMAFWVLFFCLQDTVWGLCDAHVIKNDIVFFVSSSVFHVSTVVTTFFWLKYVLEYLGEKVKHKKLYLILDGIVIGFELILVVINIFKTTLFSIVDGNYVTGLLRPLTFVNQYIVYLVIGLTTLFFVIKKDTRNNSQYRSVFFFTLAPILLGVFQLLFPDAPFYSLGYLLGFFIVHIFVVARDRETYLHQETQLQRIIDLNVELRDKQLEIDKQFDVLKSMSRVYDTINLLDFNSCVASRFDIKNSKEIPFDLVNDPHTSVNKEVAKKISEEYMDRFWEFTNLSTLEGRMKGKRVVSSEFICKSGEWVRAMYIRIDDDETGPFNKVAYTLQNITTERKREYQVYNALTHLVYSLHIFDLENDTMERLIESDIMKQIVGNEESAQKMSNTIIKATCKDEFLDMMMEFVDLSTVSKRMENKPYLTCEFLGKYHGWTRMSFIPIEIKNNQVKKIVITTEIIDSEKNEIINLIYKSTTDELTRLYNRRKYEDDLDELDAANQDKNQENCIVIALDVNGLKKVNDTLGHKAGDELIIGAGNCINKSFVSVGNAYRTGGDEFMAIVKCDEEKLNAVLADFEDSIKNWKGRMVDKLSISYGYASAKQFPDLTVRELASEADKNMYANKAAYYKQNGIERRKS